jgi:hypothetical protein
VEEKEAGITRLEQEVAAKTERLEAGVQAGASLERAWPAGVAAEVQVGASLDAEQLRLDAQQRRRHDNEQSARAEAEVRAAGDAAQAEAAVLRQQYAALVSGGQQAAAAAVAGEAAAAEALAAKDAQLAAQEQVTMSTRPAQCECVTRVHAPRHRSLRLRSRRMARWRRAWRSWGRRPRR